jgi:chaperonin cofactor prefoldin
MEDLLQVEVFKLEEELTKLKSAVEYIETAKISIEAASKIINTITRLKEEFEKVSAKAYVVIDKFDKMEIPARLDKIDSELESKASSLSSDIQNLQTRIEAINKTLFTEIKAGSRNISTDVRDSNQRIINMLESQSKAIKLMHYGLIGVFVFVVIVGVLLYLKII